MRCRSEPMTTSELVEEILASLNVSVVECNVLHKKWFDAVVARANNHLAETVNNYETRIIRLNMMYQKEHKLYSRVNIDGFRRTYHEKPTV